MMLKNQLTQLSQKQAKKVYVKVSTGDGGNQY